MEFGTILQLYQIGVKWVYVKKRGKTTTELKSSNDFPILKSNDRLELNSRIRTCNEQPCS